MYSKELKKVVNYFYIDLIDDNCMMDIEKFKEFVSLFPKTQPIFIFNYNCLEYPYINDVLDCLIASLNDFVIKCDKRKHIDILENKVQPHIINELRVKIDTSLSLDIISNRITETTQLYNYIIDLNKDNIFTFGIDLFVDKKNIIYLKQTLKILSKNKFRSKIIFKETALNSHYKCRINDNVVSNDYEIILLLKNIIDDKELLILNREELFYMLNNFMSMNCWKKVPIELCLTPNFKFQICHKIDSLIDNDPLDCFTIDECLKDDVYLTIEDHYKKYCLGCNCEDYLKHVK